MTGRAAARQAARELGRQKRATNPPPQVDSMKAAGSILKTREANRRKLADTENRDAGDAGDSRAIGPRRA
jgi:hypothetical protein